MTKQELGAAVVFKLWKNHAKLASTASSSHHSTGQGCWIFLFTTTATLLPKGQIVQTPSSKPSFLGLRSSFFGNGGLPGFMVYFLSRAATANTWALKCFW
ncbi:hypothetical protein CapIbe_023713 [Capra ibex]